MKKAVWALSGIVVVVLAGLLAAPAFIDWNQYKPEIASAAERVTGRRLNIDGDLSLSLLPLPRLAATDVRLANMAGGSRAEMLTIDEVQVRVALADLLGGRLRVQSVHVIRPDLLLENIDGRPNRVFQPAAPSTQVQTSGASVSGPVPPASDGMGLGDFDLALDRITVEGGQITVRGADGGDGDVLSGIDAELSAGSLSGPFKAQGIGHVRQMSVLFQASLGDISGERAAPLSLQVHSAEGAAEVRLSGLLGGSSEGRTLRGDLRLKGEDLTAFLNAAGLAVPTQGLHVPFFVTGGLTASPILFELTDMTAQVDQALVQGQVSYGFGRRPRTASVRLVGNSVDLDIWKRKGLFQPPEIRPVGSQSLAAEDLFPGFSDDLTADFDIELRALTLNEAVMSQVRFKASLANGTLLVDDASARLPGSTALNIKGAVTTPDSMPTFDLAAEVQSFTLRNTLEWLGLDVAAVPGGRLNSLQASAGVGGTWKELIVRDLAATVDTTTLRGAATVRPGARPAMGVALDVASVSLDAYQPPGRADAPFLDLPKMADLAWLDSFDMNLRADIGRVTFRDVPLSGVHLDLALIGGRLVVRDALVDDVLGSRVGATGGIAGFGSVTRFDDLTLNMHVPDMVRLSRGFVAEVPAALLAAGSLTAEVVLNDTPDALKVVADAVVGDRGAVRVDGTVTDPMGTPRIDALVAVRHPDAGRALDWLWPDYRPRGPLGGLSGHGHLVAGRDGWQISEGDLEIGLSQISGDVAIDLVASPRPTVNAALTGTRLNSDALRPAPDGRHAGLSNRTPWRGRTLDLSDLGRYDGSLTLSFGQLDVAGVSLAGAETAATLADGVLTLDHLRGQLGGGAVAASGRLEVTAGGGVQTAVLSVEAEAAGLDDLTALTGSAGRQNGRTTFTATLRGAGETLERLIGSLSGSGSLAIGGIGPGGEGQGPVASIVAPAAALMRFSAMAEGGPARAEATAGWSVENGIVRLKTLALAGPEVQATLVGTLDLPAWTVALSGEAQLADGLVMGLSAAGQSLPRSAPVVVNGSMVAPLVRIGTRFAPPPVDAAPVAGTAVVPRFLDRFLGPPEVMPGQLMPEAPVSLDAPADNADQDDGAVTPSSMLDAIRQGMERSR